MSPYCFRMYIQEPLNCTFFKLLPPVNRDYTTLSTTNIVLLLSSFWFWKRALFFFFHQLRSKAQFFSISYQLLLRMDTALLLLTQIVFLLVTFIGKLLTFIYICNRFGLMYLETHEYFVFSNVSIPFFCNYKKITLKRILLD